MKGRMVLLLPKEEQVLIKHGGTGFGFCCALVFFF